MATPNSQPLAAVSKKRRAIPDSSSLAIRLAVVALAGWGAALLTPYPEATPVLVILTATLTTVMLLPAIGRVPSYLWGPALGAVALILVSNEALGRRLDLGAPALTGAELWREVGGNLGVPTLILALAYLSISLDGSGFFNWCSLRIMRAARGSGRRLLVLLFFGVSALTLLTSNDIVILSMTPILVHLGANARIQNLTPFLITQFVAANTASMGLYVGNPTNIVIADAAGIDFLEYAERMAAPTLVATVTSFVLLWLLFCVLSRRNRVQPAFLHASDVDSVPFTREMAIKVAMFFACLVSLALLGTPWIAEGVLGAPGLEAVGTGARATVVVVVAFAAFAAVYDALVDVRSRSGAVLARLGQRVRRLPVEIVPFFLSFCVLLYGVERAGLTRFAREAVVAAFRHGPVAGSVATGASGVLSVNTVNNIPTAILFEKLWRGGPSSGVPLPRQLGEIHPSAASIFVDASLFASNCGANLTFMGALAGVMWLRIISDMAKRLQTVTRVPTGFDFVLYGALVVPIVTVVTCIAIALHQMVFS